ncbi:hypothetical protein BCF44_1397 [Kutzneria buriramensis]|uniref:Uncharacterized protein n=1 Tax=Kutzneria buriramensis TaxID=1045776 RepID=A0A3E0G7P0_9PSEU|nr:hypothetical protein BCF44_1397 [Kutzneria buriramensis]
MLTTILLIAAALRHTALAVTRPPTLLGIRA